MPRRHITFKRRPKEQTLMCAVFAISKTFLWEGNMFVLFLSMQCMHGVATMKTLQAQQTWSAMAVICSFYLC